MVSNFAGGAAAAASPPGLMADASNAVPVSKEIHPRDHLLLNIIK
jgi:hypothetical protein